MSKAQPILPGQVRRAEFGRTVYSATLADGVSATDVTKSDFWVHLAPTFEPLDHVEAVTADGETYIELLVARVEKIQDGPRTVRIPKLVVLNKVDLGSMSAAAKKAEKELTDAPAPDYSSNEQEGVRNQQTNAVPGLEEPADEDGDGVPDGYEVKFGGPTHKWRVLKAGVTDPLASGMSKKDATAWAKDHATKSA